MNRFLVLAAAAGFYLAAACSVLAGALQVREYPVPAGSHPHDVAPAPDGSVWYTGQHRGTLGRLYPKTGRVVEVKLGVGSSPHGVIVGPKGDAWVTDGGRNAILRVNDKTHQITAWQLKPENYANLNTGAFDNRGVHWFTGQSGIYGFVDPATNRLEVFPAPKGRGPYGIAAAPDGTIYFASLAGSYVGRIAPPDPGVKVLEPPTPGQGARRVWPDSNGKIWVSEWLGGNLARYDPASGAWREWRVPGANPRPYAVYVDHRDQVWLSDFGANAFVRFDPATETFEVVPIPTPAAAVRQILGRPGEVWGAESGTDKLVVVVTEK